MECSQMSLKLADNCLIFVYDDDLLKAFQSIVEKNFQSLKYFIAETKVFLVNLLQFLSQVQLLSTCWTFLTQYIRNFHQDCSSHA